MWGLTAFNRTTPASRKVGMDIVENLGSWERRFKSTWLAHLEREGEPDWGLYKGPRNTVAPSGTGVDLSRSRLVLLTTAGGYLRDSQEPFDAANLRGDPSVRLFPTSTPLQDLAFAHDHYDHASVDADPQVAVPLRHLEAMVSKGVVGELAPMVISVSGYQPDLRRVVDELIPAVLSAVDWEPVDSVLLVPA